MMGQLNEAFLHQEKGLWFFWLWIWAERLVSFWSLKHCCPKLEASVSTGAQPWDPVMYNVPILAVLTVSVNDDRTNKPLFNNLTGAGLKHRGCIHGLVWVCLHAIFVWPWSSTRSSIPVILNIPLWCFGAPPFSSDSTTQQGFISHACLPKDSKHYGCWWHWLQTSTMIPFIVLLYSVLDVHVYYLFAIVSESLSYQTAYSFGIRSICKRKIRAQYSPVEGD